MKDTENRIDDVDRKLVEFLVQDARRTASSLADEVHLSPTAVGRRLKRLEDAGVIMRYSAQVNYARLGIGVEALIELRFDGTTTPAQMSRVVSGTPNIAAVFMTSGDFDVVAHVRARDVPELRTVLGLLRRRPEITGTRTHLVLDSFEDSAETTWLSRPK